MNPYQVLQVSKTATKDQIKQAFRSLARKYHPDANPGNRQAEEKFKEINEAYEILSDDTKRADYDLAQSRQTEKVPVNKAKPKPKRPRQAKTDFSSEYANVNSMFQDFFGF